jgi:PAS domain S-box-containing protein
VKSYVLYTLFLHKVIKDIYIAQEIYTESKAVLDSYYANRKRWEANEGKFGENTSSAIIIISGNKATVGTVLNANNEVWEILGYEKSSVIGNNISMLMPDLLGFHHNKFVQSSFNKSVSTALTTKQSLVLAQHSLGCVIPCNLFTKLIPNLSKGIQFIGFINKAKTVDCFRQGETQVNPNGLLLFLLDKGMCLEGFNKLFLNILGRKISSIEVQRYIENDKKIDLSKHFPTIFTVKNEAAFESEEGFITTIDFTGVVKEFHENAASEIEIDAIETAKPNLTTNIKMQKYSYLKDELVYYVCTLSLDDSKAKTFFTEQSEGDANSSTPDYKQTKENLLDYHEEGSVSTTNSSVSQLGYSIQTIKGFRGKMRSRSDPCLVQCFRLSSFAILVVFITVYSVVYYLNSNLISTFKTSSKLIFLKYSRLNSHLLAVYDARILCNIYLGLQDDTSEALAERATYYFQDLSFYASKILQIQEDITTTQKGYVFDSLSIKYNTGASLELKEVVSWDDDGVVYSDNVFRASLGLALRQIVTKITDITGVSRKDYHAKTLSEEALGSWNRTMAYILFTSLHVLLPNEPEASIEIVNLVTHKGDKDHLTFIIIVIILVVINGLALITPIPFIFKSHSGTMAAISIFIRLPKEAIRKIINSSQEYKKEMNDNLGDILKSFNRINFQLESDEEKKMLADKRNKKEEDNVQEEGTEEEIAKERAMKMNTKRKLNFISISNIGFRNRLIIEIIIVLIIFGIFYAVSVTLKGTYFGRMRNLLKVLDSMIYTAPLITYILVAGQEDFSERKALHVDFWKVEKSELRRNLDNLIENTVNREHLRRVLTKYFEDVSELIEILNSEFMCNLTEFYSDIQKDCNQIYNSVLKYGFKNYANQVALEMEVLYNHFIAAVEDNDEDYLKTLIESKSFISLSEANSIFISNIMTTHLNTIYNAGNKIMDKAQTYDTIDLVIFIVFGVIIVLIYFANFLSRFKNSILKVKRMLLILPTKLIAQDLEEIKQILNSIS